MIFSAVFYQLSLEEHQTIYVCWILFICKGSASYIESINQFGSPKKNICWDGTQKLPKKINIYLRNYQTETAIFLATKHEKTIMACSYLNFSRTESTSKQQKLVASINMVPMLLRQFRRLAQGDCWSYANSLKQLILKLHLWKNVFSSLLTAYWRYKPGFCFFPDI